MLPKKHTAGDTLKVTASFKQYPASEYELSIALRGNQDIDLTIDADSDGFAGTISSLVTRDWQAGAYHWAAFVAKNGERTTVGNGAIHIYPDLTQQSSDDDNRSQIKIALDNINEVIAGKASKATQSYTVAGRSLSRYSIDELLRLRNQLAKDYQSELRAKGLLNSNRLGKQIHVRMP